jgi:hypothetical protein
MAGVATYKRWRFQPPSARFPPTPAPILDPPGLVPTGRVISVFRLPVLSRARRTPMHVFGLVVVLAAFVLIYLIIKSPFGETNHFALSYPQAESQ